MSQHIVAGLSGGVDSSVSALLAQNQGYKVTGVFMKNWEEADSTNFCSAEQDIKDAQSVCDTLAIPFKKINFAAEYWDYVFEHFLAEYQAARTPNPDILCNKEIKFNAFMNYADLLGGDFIATGHYVRKDYYKGAYRLLKGKDPSKEQSYFLYTLQQDQLAKAIFPVGDLYKSDVRQIARENKLITHDKQDSTGICFIGERRFKTFLQHYLPAQPGQIQDEYGKVIGQHSGLMYYTYGQRQGLGIGGVKNRPEVPWYVAGKDLENNVLIAVQGHNHPMLLSQKLEAHKLHWVKGHPPAQTFSCKAKIRYRQPDQACQIHIDDNDYLYATFEHAQRAVTPGQSIVLYDEDVCLGGGIITKAWH